MFDGEYGIVRIKNDGKPEQAEFDTLEEAIKCCKRFWEDFYEETQEKFLTHPLAHFTVIEYKNGTAITVFDMLEEVMKDKKNDENNNNN